MKQLLLLAFLSCSFLTGTAQQLRTAYFMDKATLRTSMNPALRPARGFISIPAAGSISATYASNGVALGDLLYHGPRNDLPRDYAPKEVIPMLNGLKNKLCCVRGNCEAEVDQMVLDLPVMADYCILPAGEKLIYATHGHIYNLKNLPPLAKGDILLHGHTHVPAWTEFGQRNVCLNPGSLSIPKENSPHSYMILENGVFYWKDVETGEIYHTRVL